MITESLIDEHIMFECSIGGRKVGRGQCLIVDRSILMLQGLHVIPELRGNGIGSHILRYIQAYAGANGYERIELDDMSDRFGQPRNIYLKHGFRYVNLEDGPEMEWSVVLNSPEPSS